jgi:hypothetical protein
MRIQRQEMLNVDLDLCAHCGAERLVGIQYKGRMVRADGDAEFSRCFGKATCMQCVKSGAYLEGREARPAGVLYAKAWEIVECEDCRGSGKIGTGRCRACNGHGKLYDDGGGTAGPLALPDRPVDDWATMPMSVDVVMHATEPRALLLMRMYDYTMPRTPLNPGMTGDDLLGGNKLMLWLEVEQGKPFYRVYEASFGRWLPEAEAGRDYGPEWCARVWEAYGVESGEPPLEVFELALRVPREILQ